MKKTNLLAMLLGLVFFFFFFSPAIVQSEELQLDKYQRMAYRVKPAVVNIISGVIVKMQYVKDNTPVQENAIKGGTGSGFIINPEGYVVTNGHVIEASYEYEKDKAKIIEEVLINFVAGKLRKEGKAATRANIEKWIEDHKLRIAGEPQSISKVVISNGDAYDFEIKKYSPPIPQRGKDVGVVKIPARDFPVVYLGNSSDLRLQQLIFPFGYPGAAAPDGEYLGEKTATEVTITRGTVSALKVDVKGVPVVQTDAAIGHGNSGGPACNEAGEVVGISTFGPEVAGFNFLVPIDTAKEFINDAGVKYNTSSKFNEKYNAALDTTWNKEWFSARDLINSALVFLPNQPDLIKLRQFVEGKVTEMGWFRRNWQKNKIAMVSLAIILLLILVVGATLVVRKAPKKVVQPEFQPAARQPQPSEIVAEGETRVEGKFLGSLTLSTGGQMGKSYPIGEKGLVIGREQGQCDIVISDANVSRIHAWVTIEKGEVVVIDRGSTNGTFVNNKKVEKTKLNSGDVIQLGQKCPTTLIFKR
jgi:hypothetical protein